MTNQQHPITPPEDLLQQLRKLGSWQEIITKAYQAGADQELEACCREIQSVYGGGGRLRAARRPKPPSDKELALELVRRIKGAGSPWALSELSVIVRALEALDD